MPGERLILRSTSDIGRFPGAAPPTRVELSIQKSEEKKQEERGCRRWFRKICPCCCKRQNSTSHDITDKVEWTKESVSEPVKPKPENGETKDTEEGKLSVCSVDLLSSKTGQNRVEHHTDLYHGDELIIRRGQTFHMEMELNRPFNADTEKMHLELKTGLLPKVSKGTHVIIPLVKHLEDERWEAKITEQNGSKIKLSVNSPANAVIGLYGLTVTTRSLKDQTPTTHNSSKSVIMLFNPWCEEDAVFLDDEEQRKEYVLNDTGRIYYGTEKQIGARTWNFGQFHEGILEASLFILEKSDMAPSGRGDPVNVVRVISALINAQDDFGVLVGNWSGDYSGGVSPAAWSSSVEILRKYHSTNGTSVNYGQCWVFSGVTTTVLRCLGIPARSVTNFQSAHDTDVSLTTDVYFDENMEPIDHLNNDSVWNFHVWNDCWMARPDLPPGNGGWQAVDSTPQETSQGIFCCGPASISAIRSGHVYLKHDTPFVFAEVNSDKIYWKRNLDGTFSQIFTEKKAVGHCISTKAVGSDEREDITHLYKHQEDSEEERIAVETASRYGSKPDVYCAPAAEDVHVEVQLDGEGPKMGCDAKLSIVVKNMSSEPRQTTLHSQVAVMHYTGVLKNAIRKDQIPVELLPNEEKTIEWILPYHQYQNQLVDQAALMLSLCGRVNETKQVLANQTSFRLRTPDLSITPLNDAVVGKEMSAKITFTNPLPCTLKNVVFRVEGLGLQKGHEIIVGDVGSHSTVTLTEHFIPSQPGPRKLVASLDCKQLTQVHGVVDIVVREQ
ncbi:protein-glutamine gamma-glutamyltransferase K [Kryptolebias marmoratus]|uniref:Protein-glutamine gamma-glutamyltransferase K n=1 Tax=Kryptolebias marmoratus TaxID=37003 RepID=A0A3Q3BDZ5_KRYMA|nr:protein-glutamine gamma-glutamyltransferase K [Kryptolebias marmoratus]